LPSPDLQPDYSFSYDKSVTDSTRVNQIINWLKLPESERPHLITAYFSSPDDAGHSFGPSSNETRQTILHVDELIGRLMTELENISLPVNVLIVSDHGMEELIESPQTYIFLDDLVNQHDTSIKVSNAGTHAHIYVKDNTKTDSIYAAIKRNAKHCAVYKQSEFPAHWHYNTPRSGDILITANPKFYITDQSKEKVVRSLQSGKHFGTHGYDPSIVKNMQGIFYAVGPDIKAGKRIPAFENIHIYPFIAKLLGLAIPAVDGNIKVLEDVIVHTFKVD
jgi:alkaline phosphatase D